MDRNVTEIMLTSLPVVESLATVADAEAIFDQEDVIALPVVTPEGALFGVLTPHHLVQFHCRSGNPQVALAWEICDTRPPLVSSQARVEDAAVAMMEARRSYVVVTDDERRPAGLVTSTELLDINLQAAGSPRVAPRGGR